MSEKDDRISTHIENVDVNAENNSNSEKSSDSGIETAEGSSEAFPVSSDSEVSPIKTSSTDHDNVTNSIADDDHSGKADSLDDNSLSSPASVTKDNSPESNNITCNDAPTSKQEIDTKDNNAISESSETINDNIPSMLEHHNLQKNSDLATSTVSLNEPYPNQTIISRSPFSRSAENILTIDKSSLNTSENSLDKDKILSDFTSQKNKVAAVQNIANFLPVTPKTDTKTSENVANADGRYPRIPKEILNQDIGSIVKNVHGIFSSVSGSLKYAYSNRSTQKPIKTAKAIPNGKLMNDIFEDESTDKDRNQQVLEPVSSKMENAVFTLDSQEDLSPKQVGSDQENTKKDLLQLKMETLERLLNEQRKENASLREQVKKQADDLQQKDQTFKELEVKLDLMGKRVEQAEREKDAAVMRYAGAECAAIEARRAADSAAAAAAAARADVDLLNNKLKSAHAEKHRIIQLYDDKCHELQNSEKEVSKVREDLKELEGRLKWTQSKLRMEMDAYKESSERAEKLSQQLTELEANKEAALASAADSAKAKQLESELKECRAALILCRHEKEELDRRLSSSTQQLDLCQKERDDACTALVDATMEIEKLKISNLRLEEEAAELAALRAKAALADTLSAQLQRETERATRAEAALAAARAQAETCARREAAALEHAARLTHHQVAHTHHTQNHEAKAQALAIDNASLRERVSTLETECTRLQTALNDETDRRNKENKVLARKVAELTEEVSEANKRLEWEKGENGVLKKKHASAIKELNRELQRALKRCEQLEAKLPPPDAPSTRTGSITSLSSMESTQTEDRLQNGHADHLPDIQVREPDRQALIERIVSLQRAAARRAERCEFLEEHAKQLTSELRNKSRLLRHMLSAMPAGAVASEDRDNNKKEIARLGGGAMAAVWGGDRNGMTLELSLEMNTRLQALLEDTLLKNITLKENMDTLGAEISRLKEKYKEAK